MAGSRLTWNGWTEMHGYRFGQLWRFYGEAVIDTGYLLVAQFKLRITRWNAYIRVGLGPVTATVGFIFRR